MAYVKTNWVDDAAPAVSASNLNKIEQGIYDAHVTADEALALAEASGEAAPALALPGYPSDGDVTILTDSLSAPSYLWRLVYLAALSKWWMLGGTDLYNNIPAAETISGTVFADLATVGPSITVPVAGTYDFFADLGHIQNSGTDDFRIGLKVGAAATVEFAHSTAAANASNGISVAKSIRAAASGPAVCKLQYRTRAGGTHTAFDRTLRARPVFLG